MGRKVAKPDVRVAEIAARQHGVISLEQLHRLGYDEKAIRRRVMAARLHRVHRGVYSVVGHPALSLEGRLLAAVLALGRGPRRAGGSVLDCWGAVISHRSAASLWGMLPVTQGSCDVMVPGNGGRAQRAGLRVHRSLSLSSADSTLRHGIPVTTPVRTVADLRQAVSAGRGGISARDLRKAIRQANVSGLPIGDEDGADRTRGDLEAAFLRICHRNRLPRPEVNMRIGPFLVDFLWRDEQLVVETDSYRHHRGRAAFQDDRARELELMRLGYDVLRLSERQIDEERGRVAEALAAALLERRRD